jgi:hypothetical protein
MTTLVRGCMLVHITTRFSSFVPNSRWDSVCFVVSLFYLSVTEERGNLLNSIIERKRHFGNKHWSMLTHGSSSATQKQNGGPQWRILDFATHQNNLVKIRKWNTYILYGSSVQIAYYPDIMPCWLSLLLLPQRNILKLRSIYVKQYSQLRFFHNLWAHITFSYYCRLGYGDMWSTLPLSSGQATLFLRKLVPTNLTVRC